MKHSPSKPAITPSQFAVHNSFQEKLWGQQTINELQYLYWEEYKDWKKDKDNLIKAEQVLTTLDKARPGTIERKNAVQILSNWYAKHFGLTEPIFEVGSLVRATYNWIGYEWEKDLAETKVFSGSIPREAKQHKYFFHNIGLVLDEKLVMDVESDIDNVYFQKVLLVSIGIVHPYMTAEEVINSAYEVKQKTLLVPFNPFMKNSGQMGQMSLPELPFVLAGKYEKQPLY